MSCLRFQSMYVTTLSKVFGSKVEWKRYLMAAAAEKKSVTLFKAWQLVLTETALLIIQEEDLTNIQVNCSI